MTCSLAAFTPEGTFTYAPSLTRFTLRYLLEVSEDPPRKPMRPPQSRVSCWHLFLASRGFTHKPLTRRPCAWKTSRSSAEARSDGAVTRRSGTALPALPHTQRGRPPRCGGTAGLVTVRSPGATDPMKGQRRRGERARPRAANDRTPITGPEHDRHTVRVQPGREQPGRGRPVVEEAPAAQQTRTTGSPGRVLSRLASSDARRPDQERLDVPVVDAERDPRSARAAVGTRTMERITGRSNRCRAPNVQRRIRLRSQVAQTCPTRGPSRAARNRSRSAALPTGTTRRYPRQGTIGRF